MISKAEVKFTGIQIKTKKQYFPNKLVLLFLVYFWFDFFILDKGAPAYCFISGSSPIEWKLFGFFTDRGAAGKEINDKWTNNIGMIESIYREFMQIKEEKPEFFEYAKPIWEQINENMIGRNELGKEEL
jgi:hypothetical protein